MHNPVIRFRVTVVVALAAMYLVALIGIGILRREFGSTFDDVAPVVLTALVIVELLASAVVVFSLRYVMLPRRGQEREARARLQRQIALRTVPPVHTRVRVLEDAWAPEGMITPEMIGEVQPHFGFDFDEVTVLWPGHRLTMSHPIGHLMLAPAAPVAALT